MTILKGQYRISLLPLVRYVWDRRQYEGNVTQTNVEVMRCVENKGILAYNSAIIGPN